MEYRAPEVRTDHPERASRRACSSPRRNRTSGTSLPPPPLPPPPFDRNSPRPNRTTRLRSHRTSTRAPRPRTSASPPKSSIVSHPLVPPPAITRRWRAPTRRTRPRFPRARPSSSPTTQTRARDPSLVHGSRAPSPTDTLSWRPRASTVRRISFPPPASSSSSSRSSFWATVPSRDHPRPTSRSASASSTCDFVRRLA